MSLPARKARSCSSVMAPGCASTTLEAIWSSREVRGRGAHDYRCKPLASPFATRSSLILLN